MVRSLPASSVAAWCFFSLPSALIFPVEAHANTRTAATVAATTAVEPTAAEQPIPDEPVGQLPPYSPPSNPDVVNAIQNWFRAIGEVRTGETFGELTARAAASRLGTGYDSSAQDDGPEVLRIQIGTLNCVSLIEYADAIARCIWSKTPTPACFLTEVEASRYRSGQRAGYASRLHYFTEWIDDNERRGRFSPVHELPHHELRRPFFFMSKHRGLYPALYNPDILNSVRETEHELSAKTHTFVTRDAIEHAQQHLRSGDVVAIVSTTPGLLITHTGLIRLDEQGRPRLLHASRQNGRVVLSRKDIADYVIRANTRRGVIVTRPEPPVVNASD
ncbi:MAG: N-acetylmuramoyl-L-alanine amidase-like domain-containing protein [Myxococcota bacterium]